MFAGSVDDLIDGGGGDPDLGQSEILSVVLDDKTGAVPTGFGINCTRVDQYPSILSSITSTRFHSRSPPGDGGKGPAVPLTLVVYPNGGRLGDTFDHLTYRWKPEGGPRPDGGNISWEEEVVEVVQKCRGEWKDVIVGGCCRVYPPQIKTLREKVNERL
jgi:homocysteine S-methyltransferase